jgi:Carboxypeptidase regulatory-like domain
MKSQSLPKSYLVSTLSTILVLLVSAIGVLGQSGTSTVNGTVADQQNNLVAGATVTLSNSEKSFTRTQATSEGGTFTFNLIPPGLYQIEVEAKGFKKGVVTQVNAQVAKPTQADVRLEVGDVAEVVTVASGSGEVLLNTQDAALGNNFTSQQITQLPLESRNVVELLSLQAGVTQEGNVTGSRADQANVTLDGIDVNEQQTGLDVVQDIAFDEVQAFSSVLRVTAESVQEFRVTTTNPNAAQGRSSGGQVALVTKSGTNEPHGSLYWSHRNTVTSANDFFNNLNGTERPTLLRNVYGGSFGGPIKKDRLFFFYSFEGRRDASQTPVTRDVPLASLGRGEVRYPIDTNDDGLADSVRTRTASEIGALFPATGGVNPLALAALADAARKYPANDFTFGDGLNTAGFRFNAPTPLEYNAHIARFDWNATKDGRHVLFFRGNYQHDLVGGVPQFPDTPAPNFWNHPYGFVGGHTWVINNRLVNNFRYGLTREAFTNQGDSTENSISFRFVFSPRRFLRTLSRVTPTHNITDDLSWIKGNHNFQFGTNIRVIRNRRDTFANSFDSAVTNPSYYDESGAVLDAPITDIFGSVSPVQNAVAAILGRFSQYSANFNFEHDGNIQPVGDGVAREFATEEYDWYVQDVWKLRSNISLTLGLRYGLSRPVYETHGLQVKPTLSLSEFFQRRVDGAAAGRPYNDLITFDLAGPANDRPGFYNLDKNNFQPRVSIAWSPAFKSGLLHKIFGNEGSSVLRGGFAVTNDYFGQQLAVQFDLNNPAGFASAFNISANTFNVSDSLAPLFTGFTQNVRNLPQITVPGRLTFPFTPPAAGEAIETSLDDRNVSPINYSWNVSFGRTLPAGLSLDVAYIGRSARNLLASRDVAHFNNLKDPTSGMDWYTAAGLLDNLRVGNVPVNSVQPIPFFENLFPTYRRLVGGVLLTPTQSAYFRVAREAAGGQNILDWTFLQSNCGNCLDNRGILPNMFVHPQFATLDALSTIASSDYHAATFTLRERFKDQLTFDLNYTFSKSMDNASGLQQDSLFGYSSLILNPLDPNLTRSVSDFDVRHIINANAVWQVPLGRGRRFLTDAPSVVNGVLGGWQISGIFRANSGLPVRPPIDQAQWATNWNTQSFGVRVTPIQSAPSFDGPNGPNLFPDPEAAYRSFRNARAGEVGDRNSLRLPHYWTMDLGLSKSFDMPWSENHKLQFRAEAFNVTNTQHMGTIQLGRVFGLDVDPSLTAPQDNFGTFSGIQGTPRVLQFGFRYSF